MTDFIKGLEMLLCGKYTCIFGKGIGNVLYKRKYCSYDRVYCSGARIVKVVFMSTFLDYS